MRQSDGAFPLTYVSPNVQDLLGYASSEVVVHPDFFADRLHPDDKSDAGVPDLEALTHGRCVQEYRLRRADGRYLWLRDEAKLARDAAGAPKAIYGTWTDITAYRARDAQAAQHEAPAMPTGPRSLRARKEFAELRESSRTRRKGGDAKSRPGRSGLKRIADAIPAMIARYDRHCRYLYVNEAYWEAVQEFTDDLVGRTIAEIWGETYFQMRLPRIERALAGETQNFEGYWDPSGSGRQDRWATITYLPEHATDGSVIGFMVFAVNITERRNAERALAQREEELRAVFDNAPVNIVLKDLEGRYLMVNQRWQECFGLSASEVLGKTTAEVRGADVAKILASHDAAALNSRGPILFEIDLKAGEDPRTLLISRFVIRDENGVPSMYCAIEVDITARRQAERRLEQREKDLSDINDTVPAVIARLDRNFRYRYMNAYYRDVLGDKAEDALGRHLDEVFGAGFYDKRKPYFDRAMAGETVSFEGSVDDHKGRARIFLHTYTPERNVDGEVDGIHVFGLDVTERRAAERALAQRESELRDLIDNAPVNIVLKDLSGRFMMVNRRWQEFFGLSAEQVLGKTTADLRSSDVAQQVAAHEREALDRREPVVAELDLEVGRTRRTLLVSRFVMRGEGGAPLMYCSMEVDITARREAEHRLEQREQELRAINDALPALVARMDRDFRYRYLNAPMRRFIGNRVDNPLGRSLREVFGDKAYAARRPFLLRAFAGETVTFESVLPDVDGRARPFLHTYVPERDGKGGVHGIYIFGIDITEQRQAEDKLRKSEREIRLINDTAPIIIARFDRDTRVLYGNAFYARFHGKNIDELIGRRLEDFSDPAQTRTRREYLRRCLAGETVTYEAAHHSPVFGDRVLRRTYLPEVGADGKVVSYIAIGVDITEQERALEALRESELRFRQAQLAARIGSYDWDIDGSTRWSSDMAYHVMGLDPEKDDLGVKAFNDAIHPDDRSRVEAERKSSVKNRGVSEIEFRVVLPTGEVRHVLSRGSFIRDANGKAVRKVGTLQDITDRKQIALALEASEQKYRRLHETMIDAFGTVDMSGRFIETNQAFRALTGYSQEEISTLTYEELTPKKWHAMEKRIVTEQVLKRGYSDVFQKEYRRKDGTIVPIELRTVVLKDGDGRPTGMWAIVRDISERKLAEEEATRFKMALDQTLDCVFMFEPDSLRFVYVNRGAIEQVGYSEAELFGMTPVDIKPDFDLASFRELIAPLLAGERNGLRIETTHEHKDGTVIPVDLSLQLVSVAPGRSLFVAMVRDISEQKRIERVLRESEARLREAQRIAKVGQWSLDITDGAFDGGEEALRIIGQDETSVTRGIETMTKVVHPDDLDEVKEAFEAAIAGTRPYDVEHRVVRRDGEVAYVHAQAELIRDDAGRPLRLTGALQDITERRQLEEQLRQSQRHEAIGRLSGGIAHDFNNLLGVLVGNLDLLDLELSERPDAQAILRRAIEAAQPGASLTQRLLSYGRRQTLVPQRLVVGAFVDDLSVLMRRTLGDHITIVPEHGDDVPDCMADPGQLEAAILNLAINARDAMPEGGRLTVEVHAAHIGKTSHADAGDARPGEYVAIRVTDTGLGMTPEVRQRATEPFFTTKEIGQGSGLGLSMIQGFVQQSGGFMTIESEVGQGTTVTLYLPAAASSRLSTTPTPSVTRSAG